MDKLPDRLRGLDFLCTCPGGVHGYFIVVEGDSAEDALKAFPESLRMGSMKALALEIFKPEAKRRPALAEACGPASCMGHEASGN